MAQNVIKAFKKQNPNHIIVEMDPFQLIFDNDCKTVEDFEIAMHEVLTQAGADKDTQISERIRNILIKNKDKKILFFVRNPEALAGLSQSYFSTFFRMLRGTLEKQKDSYCPYQDFNLLITCDNMPNDLMDRKGTPFNVGSQVVFN